MSELKRFIKPLDNSVAAPAISVNVIRERELTPWHFCLICFMRLLACLWLLQGLWLWAEIVVKTPSILQILPVHYGFVVGFFAILDLIAAVGLWLVTPWGGVLWILAVATQLASLKFRPGLFFFAPMIAILDLVLIIIYFVLTYYASKEDI